MSNELIIKVGVVGVGHLGKFHIEQYQSIDKINLVGFFDIDKELSRAVEKKYDIKKYNTLDQLLSECDAISLVTPTVSHFEVAKRALLNNCHIFIEKPITQTIEEAKKLIQLGKNNGKIIQRIFACAEKTKGKVAAHK